MKNPFVYLLMLCPFFFSCSDVKEEEPYVIAFSQCMMDDVWRQAMLLEMNIEASNYNNIRIVIADAKESNKTTAAPTSGSIPAANIVAARST